MNHSRQKGINQWAFPEEMSLENIFRLAKETGFPTVEVAITEKGEISLGATREEIEKIKESARTAGIEVSGLATGLLWDYSLTSDNPSEQEKAKQIVRKMLEVAAWLEVDTILVIPGAVDVFFKPDVPVVPYDKVYMRSLQALKPDFNTCGKFPTSKNLCCHPSLVGKPIFQFFRKSLANCLFHRHLECSFAEVKFQ